jgi:hypothetical protein
VPDTVGAGVPADTAGVESPIGADLVGIVENLLMLGEEMIVMGANNNLRFPQFSCAAWVPEERRDRNKPIQYVVTASPELERKFAEFQDRQKSKSVGGQGSCWREFATRRNTAFVSMRSRAALWRPSHMEVWLSFGQFPPQCRTNEQR